MTEPTATPDLAASPSDASIAGPGATASAEAWPASRVLVKRALQLVALATGLGLILVSKIPVCPMANLTGLPCPGCGLTRASLACFHGHFGDAARLQPLVFFATPMVGVCSVLAAHSWLKRGKVRFPPPVARWVMPPLKALYAALIVLWVVRFFGVLGGPVPVEPSLFARIF